MGENGGGSLERESDEKMREWGNGVRKWECEKIFCFACQNFALMVDVMWQGSSRWSVESAIRGSYTSHREEYLKILGIFALMRKSFDAMW